MFVADLLTLTYTRFALSDLRLYRERHLLRRVEDVYRSEIQPAEGGQHHSEDPGHSPRGKLKISLKWSVREKH